MKKSFNFNYVILFYDVEEERVQKVFKVCKKYLNHHQYSVFRGHITVSKYIAMKEELKKVIDQKRDFITVIKLLNENNFEEETIGTNKKAENNLFL